MTKAPDQTTPTPPTQEGKQIVKASYSGGEKIPEARGNRPPDVVGRANLIP